MTLQKFIYFLITFAFFAGTAFAADPAPDSLTLKECFALALGRSETVAIQEELIEETKGVMMQSLSTALPKLAFSYSEKWQDVQKGGTLGGSDPEGKFTFTQPLFTGFKEFAAIRASKHIGKQREAELKRAKQLLFTDVSDAFFLYLNYQDEEKAVLDVHKALLERVGELKKREIIGKSRLSEIASAESRLSRNEADLEDVRARKEISGQLLEFLVGRSFSRLIDEGDSAEALTITEASARINERPDVVAAKEVLESLKQNLFSAKSAFWPSVTLTGNAYTKRLDVNEGNDWDATVTVNVPIFNGLYDHGQVRQAQSQLIAADLRLTQAQRVALLEIKNAYARWEANGRRVAALEKAITAAEKNFFLQIKDFQNSLVNNLDVLQALEDLQGVLRELVTAKTDARRSYWALKVATGEIEQ